MAIVLGCPSCFPGLTRRNANVAQQAGCRTNVCLGVVSHWKVSGVFSLSVGQLNYIRLKHFFQLYMARKIGVYRCMLEGGDCQHFFVVVPQCFPYIHTSNFQYYTPLVVKGSAHEPGLAYERIPSFWLE